jgi:DNA-binding GntR family transcriptional regulator
MATTTEQAIVQHILEAIAEHRLKAGTKLGEQALSELFSCNRDNVRRALLTLSTRKVVDLKPNRGAFVAMPTPEEARNVFQARRAIEKTIVRNVVGNARERDIARLRAHNEKERKARGSGSRREAIRMSGEFHRILSEIGQNDVLGGFLKELVLRSSLIIGLYAPMSAPLCEDHEHREIVDAIEAGDEAKANDLVDAHLRHLEDSIQFEKDDVPEDLRAILFGG